MTQDTATLIGSISTASGYLASQLGYLLGSGGPIAVAIATATNNQNKLNSTSNPMPPEPSRNQSSSGTGIPQVDMFLSAARQAWNRIEAMGVGAFRVLITSVTRFLDPRTIAASAVNAPTSGMSLLDKSFKILGATLGLVLLPIFATLAAVVLAVALNIETALIPVIDNLTTFLADNLPSAIRDTEAAFYTLIDVTNLLVNATMGMVNLFTAVPQELANLFGLDLKDIVKGALSGGLVGAVTPYAEQRFQHHQSQIQSREKDSESGVVARYVDATGNQRETRSDAKGNPVAKSFGDEVKEAFGLLKSEFQRGVGGPSQSTSIADIGRQIQQAALNQSPFEQKMLELMMKATESLENMGQKLAKPVKP